MTGRKIEVVYNWDKIVFIDDNGFSADFRTIEKMWGRVVMGGTRVVALEFDCHFFVTANTIARNLEKYGFVTKQAGRFNWEKKND